MQTKEQTEAKPLIPEVITEIPAVKIDPNVVRESYQDTVIRLISRHEFYAHILLQLKVRFVDNPKMTLGVGIRNSQVELVVGNEFFMKSNNDQRVFIPDHQF